jgi:predicted dehydrogenase
MQELHFGVIGTGYMGKLEARLAQVVPGCYLAGLWNRTERTARELARELGCEHYPTVEAMLADPAVNAVIVATANNAHLEPVLAAAQAGKHIFLEKPMALTMAECRQMIAATRAAGITLMLGHPQRFMDGIRVARKALLVGEIGEPVALRVERTFWVDLRGSSPHWKMQRSLSGGHLFHHMHELCTARYLLGEYDTVYAQMANLAHQSDGPEAEDDVVQVATRFKSGVLGTFEFGSAYRRRQHYFRIHGTEGTIIINLQGGTLSISGRSGEIMRPIYDDPNEQRSSDDAYAQMGKGRVHGAPQEEVPLFLRELVADELRAMVAHVNGTFDDPGNEDLFGGEAGIRAVEVAQAAQISNQQRTVAQLPLKV